jgi:hypothetical protein
LKELSPDGSINYMNPLTWVNAVDNHKRKLSAYKHHLSLEKKYNVVINIESDPGKLPGKGSLEFCKEDGNQKREEA